MGLLSRLRAWITGSTGDDESAESPADADGTAEGNDADGDPTGLDPSAATETRTAAATDDAVDALRDVRRSQEVDPVDTSPDGNVDGSDDPASGAGAGADDSDESDVP